MTRTKVGDIVEIEFDDHAEGGDVITFRVWGRVAKRTPRSVTVHVWDYADEHGDSDEDNVHAFTIARKAIRSIYKLSREA